MSRLGQCGDGRASAPKPPFAVQDRSSPAYARAVQVPRCCGDAWLPRDAHHRLRTYPQTIFIAKGILLNAMIVAAGWSTLGGRYRSTPSNTRLRQQYDPHQPSSPTTTGRSTYQANRRCAVLSRSVRVERNVGHAFDALYIRSLILMTRYASTPRLEVGNPFRIARASPVAVPNLLSLASARRVGVQHRMYPVLIAACVLSKASRDWAPGRQASALSAPRG